MPKEHLVPLLIVQRIGPLCVLGAVGYRGFEMPGLGVRGRGDGPKEALEMCIEAAIAASRFIVAHNGKDGPPEDVDRVPLASAVLSSYEQGFGIKIRCLSPVENN